MAVGVAGGILFEGYHIPEICSTLLGKGGSVIAMISVIACPISSADTAYRSARLTIADAIKLDQKSVKNSLTITIPLLGVGAALTQVDVTVIWRYFSWSKQILAMISLWVEAVYLASKKGKYFIAAIPATFMSAVSCTYILMSPEGFKLSAVISYPVGIVFAVACFTIFMIVGRKRKVENEETPQYAKNNNKKAVAQ